MDPNDSLQRKLAIVQFIMIIGERHMCSEIFFFLCEFFYFSLFSLKIGSVDDVMKRDAVVSARSGKMRVLDEYPQWQPCWFYQIETPYKKYSHPGTLPCDSHKVCVLIGILVQTQSSPSLQRKLKYVLCFQAFRRSFISRRTGSRAEREGVECSKLPRAGNRIQYSCSLSLWCDCSTTVPRDTRGYAGFLMFYSIAPPPVNIAAVKCLVALHICRPKVLARFSSQKHLKLCYNG